MADPNNTTSGQDTKPAGTDTKPAAGDGKQTDSKGGDSGGQKAAASFTQADVDRMINEALQKQSEKSKADADEAARQNGLTEKQKADERLKQLEDQVRTDAAAKEFRKVANVANADDLFDLVAAKVEFDKAGKPKNIQALVDGLKKSFPKLFENPAPGAKGYGGADGGAGQNGAPADMNSLIRSALRR